MQHQALFLSKVPCEITPKAEALQPSFNKTANPKTQIARQNNDNSEGIWENSKFIY